MYVICNLQINKITNKKKTKKKKKKKKKMDQVSCLTKCPLQPDSFLKIAQLGVMGFTIMRLWTDGWMDGRMDSMLTAISPKPLVRRITKFNKRS